MGTYASRRFFVFKTHVFIWPRRTSCGVLVTLKVKESVNAQSCPTLCDPMDCRCQAPLSIEFSKQECWSGLPFPSPGGSSRSRDRNQVFCNAGLLGSSLGSRRSPWRREWQPTPVFSTGESHGQRSLASYCPRGHRVGQDLVA